MAFTPSNKLIAIFTITAVVVTGFLLFKGLFPVKPNLSYVPNPVSDRSLKNWDELESQVPKNPLKELYFGDMHVHTNLSFDAYIAGTLRDPGDAYQFAKGYPVEVFGSRVRIERPLDFTAVTDHSELIGELYTIQTPDAPRHNAFVARYFRSVYNENREFGVDTIRQRDIFRRVLKRGSKSHSRHPGFFGGFETTSNAWSIILDAAEAHYVPGEFTTFAGFEWSLLSGEAHLHRNVIFRDMKVPDYPKSSLELTSEEQLWKWLDTISAEGSTVMAIPHNTNLAEGGAFREVNDLNEPIDRAYAQMRQDYEPLIEIHQAKGNSEVHAAFWKNDEFAGFENHTSGPPKENNYVRWALKKGLEYEAQLGVNPFKYGIIGSTDTHSGAPGNTEESDSFLSNHGILDLMPEGRQSARWILDDKFAVHEVLNPGGLVAVWAPANTRSHLYDAMKQKEVYATSGSRINLRFFGGSQFSDSWSSASEMAAEGYERGVPMGSDLDIPDGETPQFLIWAEKDPLSANLDRVQVIKGWQKDNGPLRESIYNVALSDERIADSKGKTPSNGATVNMTTGEWDKNKGAENLYVRWTDPDFDKDARAFYYVRVIENPTASWKLWDKIRYGVNYSEGSELTVQERAWSSPIWYSPISK
ncbi:MAG: DUF3604 domain-containing protein [Bacteroidetes bacterium]|nr:DUF3604 domain-containing protein [Bacteroidota bacterium]